MNDIDQVIRRLAEADPAPISIETLPTDSWTVLFDTICERSGKMQATTTTTPWWRRGPAIATAVFVLILGAGAVLLTIDPADPAAVAEPSTTSQPAVTTVASAATTSDVIEVTFDGSLCTVKGQTEVPAGDHIFVFRDESDLYTDFNVAAYADGNSFQDVVDIQNESGGPGVPFDDPPWVSGALYSFEPLDIDLAENETAHRYNLEPGQHGIWLWAADPLTNWLCSPLVVVEQ